MSTEAGLSGRPASDDRPVVPAGRTAADLALFWNGYAANIRRYAWHLLDLFDIPKSEADADDITQEVYVALQKKWPEVRHPRAYARSKAEGAVRKAQRIQKRRGHVAHNESGERTDDLGTADYVPGPEETLIARQSDEEIMVAIPKAFDRLTDKEHDAVILGARGLSRKEVAAELGVAEGTVSVHRTRGLNKLRGDLLPIASGIALSAIIVLVGIYDLHVFMYDIIKFFMHDIIRFMPNLAAAPVRITLTAAPVLITLVKLVLAIRLKNKVPPE